MYHVMSRGDQREDIFLDGVDRHDFIKTLAEAGQIHQWMNGPPDDASQPTLDIQ